MRASRSVTHVIELNEGDVKDFLFILQLAEDYIKEWREKRINTMIAPSAASETQCIIEMYRDCLNK